MSDEKNKIKIGMYSIDEILEFMTNGEGRSFIGRSMYDAILDYITNLQQKYNDNVSKYEKLLEKYFNMRHRVDNAIDYIVGYNLANSIILERSYADLLKILQGESDESKRDV